MDTATQAREMLAALNHPVVTLASDRLKESPDSLQVRPLLEKEFPVQVCLDVLDCLTSRNRYQHKFWKAEQWALIRAGAEQATDHRIARWRSEFLAQHIPEGRLIELGCGIGGDSIFLNQHFSLTACEANPARAILAEHNLTKLSTGTNAFEVRNQECDVREMEGDILFCDPARRADKRLSNPEEWLPPLSHVLTAFTEERFGTVVIKCAPGLNLDHLGSLRAQASVSFLSISGALKECQIVLRPDMALTQAVLINECGERTIFERLGQGLDLEAPKPGLYLHNPDPAILRAEALDSLAHKLNAGIVHPKIGYLIGPSPCLTEAAQSFEVLEESSLNWVKLKKRIQALAWTEFEYLGRGVPFSQTDVRKRLPKLKRKSGQAVSKGSLIIYREDVGYRAILARRVTQKGMDSL